MYCNNIARCDNTLDIFTGFTDKDFIKDYWKHEIQQDLTELNKVLDNYFNNNYYNKKVDKSIIELSFNIDSFINFGIFKNDKKIKITKRILNILKKHGNFNFLDTNTIKGFKESLKYFNINFDNKYFILN